MQAEACMPIEVHILGWKKRAVRDNDTAGK
jgi:hypothetical protein